MFDWVRQPNSIERNPMDWVWLGSVNKFTWAKVMLCGLRNTKNVCYTEVAWAFQNLLLIFNTSFTKIKSSESKRLIEFDCPIFFVWVWFHLIAELNRTQSMDWDWLGSIEFDWNSVWLGLIDYAGIHTCSWKLTHFHSLYWFWFPSRGSISH